MRGTTGTDFKYIAQDENLSKTDKTPTGKPRLGEKGQQRLH